MFGILPSAFFGDVHVLVFRKVAAEIGAVDAFFAHFCPDGGAAERPLRPGIERGGEHVSAMEVLARLGILNELEVVEAAHPRNLRHEVYASFTLGLYGYEVAARGFPLVGIGGGVERVGSEIVCRGACLEVEGKVAAVVGELAKALSAFEGAVCHGTVGTLVASACRSAPSPSPLPGGARLGTIGVVGASFHACFEGRRICSGTLRRTAGDHVDGAAESLTAHHARCRALENLDALNVGNV